MGYDAIGMGEWEVSYLMESSVPRFFGPSVPLLCANVVDASSGKLITPEAYIVKKLPTGLRVGIIAVVGEDRFDQNSLQRLGIHVLPPAQAIAKYLPELKKKSDLIVLISHTQADKAKQLATEVQGIDIVIGGHISPPTPDFPEQAGTALFMHPRSSGKYVGKLVLDIGADRKIASFTGEYVPMSSELPDDPEVAEMVRQHDQEVVAFYSRAVPRPEVNIGPKPFVSSAKCGECHPAELASWSKTKHRSAFDALRKDKRTTDSECAKCHTTAFGEKGGFVSETATPQLLGVQCEACHGPGVTHVRRPAKGYGTVSENTCRRCHDQPNSPGFKYVEYRQKILHSADSSAERTKH